MESGKKRKISQKHNNLINMHLKCVYLCQGVMCVLLKSWAQSLKWLTRCIRGGQEGAPHPLCTVALVERRLDLGPATSNYTRFALTVKTSHAAENLAHKDGVERRG